jgi:hypothetical protein
MEALYHATHVLTEGNLPDNKELIAEKSGNANFVSSVNIIDYRGVSARSFHKCAPIGTESLPLEERIRIYIEVFESGCSNTEMDPESSPEDCPTCVRAFVYAVKNAVGYTGIPAIPIPTDVY